MSHPKDIRLYPEQYMRIVEILEKSPTLTLPCPSRGNALHTRQKFYAFRLLLLNDPHIAELYPHASAISIRLEGENNLVFSTHRTLFSPEAEEILRQTQVPVSHSAQNPLQHAPAIRETPPRLETSVEDVLYKYGYVDKVEIT